MALLAVMMAACNSTDDNLRAMVPDDAVGVVSIDVNSVLTKAGMLRNDTVTVPQELKAVLEESDVTMLGDLLAFLPTSGFDFNTRWYVFFSPGIYKAVVLIPLKDDDQATKLIEKITSSQVKDLSGVDFVSHLDYGYAIDDDVLLIGRFSNPVDDEVAANAASAILDKTKPSLLSNHEVAEHIDKDSCDLNAYINVKGLSTILKSNSRLSTVFGNIPAIEIITDSDIKAMIANLNFSMSKEEGESAKVNTLFTYNENGQYSTLYDNLIAASDENAVEALAVIPGELDTYVGIKIDGSKLAAQPQMSKMFEILESSPFTSGLKYNDILSSIKGVMVFGFGDSQVSDYNFTVSAQTQNPSMIIDQIVAVANSRGQSPWQRKGEYIYDYENQGIALGQSSGVFYLRCVDFETGYSAAELPVLPTNINNSSVVVYKQIKVKNKTEGFFNWGLHDKSKGSGLYYTADEKENVVVSLLKYLCWKDPNNTQNAPEDDYDYGF